VEIIFRRHIHHVFVGLAVNITLWVVAGCHSHLHRGDMKACYIPEIIMKTGFDLYRPRNNYPFFHYQVTSAITGL
jgi:hypothetical protein